MSSPTGGVLVPVGDTGWSERERYALRRGTTRIGRSAAAEISIRREGVSRLHAELDWADGALFLTHKSQTNRTLVNGIPVFDPVVLKSGDVIEIGEDIQLRVELFELDEEAMTRPLENTRRRIYAVMFIDLVGYARLTALDEVGTAERLERNLSVVREEARRAGGTVANIAGDGVLLLFNAVVGAVDCAIAIQKAVNASNEGCSDEEAMLFRIGIHSGDVVIASDTNHYGDAANVAARVQAMAPPGGILVTGTVHDQLQGSKGYDISFLKTNQPKNIGRDIRIYQISF